MAEILALHWRAYPAAVLVAVGIGLAASGVWMALASRRLPRRRADVALAYRYLYVFRRVVVGLALAGAGLAWTWQVPWLFAISVCVGAGELIESSSYIWVLRWGQRRVRLRTARRPPAAASPAHLSDPAGSFP
jgi:hypothetical protein